MAVAVLVVAVVVASSDQVFWAPRRDRGGLSREESKRKGPCCPPSRFGGTGSSGAAAWQPQTLQRGYLLLSLWSPGVTRGHLLLTAREKGASAFFIEFPWSRETPHFCSLFQLLGETPTHFASEAENPQEAQRKPREVSTHNVLMKASTAQWLRAGGRREAGRAL